MLPNEFIPERWLDSDSRFQNDKREVLQPFSLGPRNCIGKKSVSIFLMWISLILTGFQFGLLRDTHDIMQTVLQLRHQSQHHVLQLDKSGRIFLLG